jgi:hypothetical protein
MFIIGLDLFSIRTIKIPTHIELVSKPVHIPNLSIADPIPKQHVESTCVLDINQTIPPNTIKQHILETLFHPEVGKMIIDKTLTRK